MAKICFITAIYGNYESSCKKFVKQTVETDFICFTDNKNITNNGWIIDTTPYHIVDKSPLDNGNYINSLSNNKHTYNIAKYYKQAFRNIPVLDKYDVVVWLDGTLEIIYEGVSEYILDNIYTKKIITWNHEMRKGILREEVDASRNYGSYSSIFWNGQYQPYQDVDYQYKCYIDDGYDETFFKKYKQDNPHIGLWLTCFIAFLHKDTQIKNFLDLWYLQTLKYSTQDQIGFPYTCQKVNIVPYTLPDDKISGNKPHFNTMFYKKHQHGW